MQAYSRSMIDFPSTEQMRQRASLKWNGLINPLTHKPADGAWVAEMDFGTPPEVSRTIISAVEDGVLGYMPRGVPKKALDALRDFYAKRCQWDIDPDSLGLLPDVLSALRAMLDHLAQPDVPVIVPTPSYMPFLTIPGQHGHPVIEVPSIREDDGTYRLNLEGIAKAATPGCVIILCNPWNPVGRAFDADELRAFAQVADHSDAWIFNDEIHFPLTMPGVSHTPLLLAAPEVAQRTVTATAASKGWNVAGLKCAQWIVTDPALRKNLAPALESLGDEATPLGARAAAAAFAKDRAWLDQVRAYVAGNAREVSRIVAQFAPGVAVTRPQATYLTWWDCSALDLGGRIAADICLEDANVGVNAGRTLGKGFEQFIRFNVGTPRPAVTDMAQRIAKALAKA